MSKEKATITEVTALDRDALLKATATVPESVEELRQSAITETRKRINVIQTLAPALRTALQAEPQDQAAVFQNTLDACAALSARLLPVWGIDPEDAASRWLRNITEKALVNHLGQSSSTLDDGLLLQLAAAADHRALPLPTEEPWMGDHRITAAVFRGLSLIAIAQMDYDFARPSRAEDLEHIKDQVLAAAIAATPDLVPSLLPAPERTQFFAALLDQAFDLAAAVWRHNAALARAAQSRLTADQLKNWRAANPNGFSLANVDAQIEQSMARLVRLTLAARKDDGPRRRR